MGGPFRLLDDQLDLVILNMNNAKSIGFLKHADEQKGAGWCKIAVLTRRREAAKEEGFYVLCFAAVCAVSDSHT
jgi:hypothetical protein